MQATLRLRPHQIEFFHENGFLALDAITTPEEVTVLRERYDRMFAEAMEAQHDDFVDLGGGDTARPVMPHLRNPEKHAPEFADSLMRANAHAVACQLLGDGAQTSGSHCVFKPPRISPEMPWHQDEAYWDSAYEYSGIAIWVALQDVTVDMGCMWFVPGRRGEVLPHRPISADECPGASHGVVVRDWEKHAARAVACPLPAGGVTIHHNRTMHRTGPNTSAQPRRAYILSSDLPWKKREVPREDACLPSDTSCIDKRRNEG